ncbi:MAG TPA: ammonium transporter [Chitinispirillaceae bacterium]|nr:ammonium transporter [Chitinispirillaceae bacterium]
MGRIFKGATLLIIASAGALLANDGASYNMLDTFWVLMAGFLVFFMNAGFAFVESGFCRAKNVVNILAKNYVVFAIAAIAYWAIGYGFMFGNGSIIGTDSFMVNETAHNPVTNIPVFVFFFFQLAFASAGCSIISGAVAERIKFMSFIIFGTLMVAFIYPLTGHWIWGGGWLSAIGFHDFAGSTAVHSVGGWCALSGIILLGPRIGKYRPDGTQHAILGHSIPLATLGGFILWLGWFGFNPGSQLAMDTNVPRIALTTALASCTGTVGAMITSWIFGGKPDLSMIINGCLAGLVAITAPCAVVSPAGSLTIGLVAGIIVVFAVYFFDRIHLDDPVGALSVHLVNGIWGTIAVGLFAVPQYFNGKSGLFYGGGFSQFSTQIIGVLAVAATVLSSSFVFWAVIKAIFGLRVSREEEISGLDVGEMGLEGYNGFQIFTTEDISPAMAIEPAKKTTSKREVRNETGRSNYTADKIA